MLVTLSVSLMLAPPFSSLFTVSVYPISAAILKGTKWYSCRNVHKLQTTLSLASESPKNEKKKYHTVKDH